MTVRAFVTRPLTILCLVLALAVAIGATVLGGLLNEEIGPVDCASNPCAIYHSHGWPWTWRTDAPGWLINLTSNEDSFFAFGDSGYAPGVFYFTAAMWFTIIVSIEGFLFLAIPWLWRHRRIAVPRWFAGR